jgi:hypothetical protein
MNMQSQRSQSKLPQKRQATGTFPGFVRRMGFFWLPIFVVIVCGLELFLWRSGETWPISRVLEFQAGHSRSIFLRKHFGQDIYAYKWMAVMQKQPEVVVLGSSRVMKFRAEMFGLTSVFDRPAQFYNCGGMIQSTKDLQLGVSMLLKAYIPKVAIIGVDMWWLNGNVHQSRRLQDEIQYDATADWRQHLQAFRNIVKSREEFKEVIIATQKQRIHEGIGLGTVAGGGAGFRADGSIRGSRDRLPIQGGEWKYVDAESPPVKHRVLTQTGQFVPADSLSNQRLEELKAAISELRGLGVFVIVLLPPLSNEVDEILQMHQEQKKLLEDYRTIVPELCKQLEVACFDASTPAKLGLDDRYMADGFHGEETLHLHILKHLLQLPQISRIFPAAAQVVDVALTSEETNFWHPKL